MGRGQRQGGGECFSSGWAGVKASGRKNSTTRKKNWAGVQPKKKKRVVSHGIKRGVWKKDRWKSSLGKKGTSSNLKAGRGVLEKKSWAFREAVTYAKKNERETKGVV